MKFALSSELEFILPLATGLKVQKIFLPSPLKPSQAVLPGFPRAVENLPAGC